MSSRPQTTPDLTREQSDILADAGRVRVVRAGPGSGKTRVFVTELERRLATWSSRSRGIAALSFTNVAADEVSRRLGGPAPHPHYVGTLDSFVWRFIVRPFGRIAGVTANGPRLVPAPVARSLDRPQLKVGAGDHDWASLFDLILQVRRGAHCCFRPHPFSGRLLEVSPPYLPAIRQAKRDEWANHGRLTHADCHALAWKLLRHPHADEIVSRLALRFPVILLDEFQDTNYFLGRTMLRILEDERVQALVVGDRDQSIFTFGGADRELFQDAQALTGASARSLRITHRFGARIAAVASFLARSGEAVKTGPSPHADRVVLALHGAVRHLDERTIDSLAQLLRDEQCVSAAFLARRNAWLGNASERAGDDACPLRSKAARSLHDASLRFRLGDTGAAVALVARVLEDLVLDGHHASPAKLESVGIHRLDWKRAVRRILFSCTARETDEAWGDWRARIKEVVASEVHRLRPEGVNGRVGAALKKGFRKDLSDGPRTVTVIPQARHWEELSVHRAKGREFDGVVLYWPRPGGSGRVGCPSEEWWSDDPESDEREIAYVAATRARKLLVFCLHRTTAEALRTLRPEFYAMLDVLDLDAMHATARTAAS